MATQKKDKADFLRRATTFLSLITVLNVQALPEAGKATLSLSQVGNIVNAIYLELGKLYFKKVRPRLASTEVASLVINTSVRRDLLKFC